MSPLRLISASLRPSRCAGVFALQGARFLLLEQYIYSLYAYLFITVLPTRFGLHGSLVHITISLVDAAQEASPPDEKFLKWLGYLYSAETPAEAACSVSTDERRP